jgi:hypothetical protein
MPDRVIRAELLNSEAWLALKDNADRLAYLSCLLGADTLGNMPAGLHRCVHAWRPYGIDTPEKAAKTLSDLADVDLVRLYTADSKQYLHIPRFKQSRRFLGKLWPLSPWSTIEEKQEDAKNSPVNHGESRHGVGVGVGVGVDKDQKHVVPSPKVGASYPQAQQINTVLQGMKVNTDKPAHRSREEQLAYVKAFGNK